MRRKKAPLIVAAVVQPVVKRLARIEGILHEMRFEQAIQLKRVNAIQEQFDHLLEDAPRHPSKPERPRSTRPPA